MVYYPSQVVVFVVILLNLSSTLPSRKLPAASNTYSYNSISPHHYQLQLAFDTTVCRTVPGLSRAQLNLCKRQPDAAAAAFEGLQQAVHECQHQFRNHRWNCSALATRGKNPYVSAILQKGFRETAFAYAMISAGVAIAVARACSSGMVSECGCERIPKGAAGGPRWKWAGCSHNARYGVRYSRTFLDTAETQADDIRSRVNLHNNQVGRMAVTSNMQIKCKCHGMSGSCELKTCWRATPDYRTVGRALKEKYNVAVLVDQNNLGKKSIRRFNSINHGRRRQRQQQKSSKNRGRPGKQWTPRRTKYKRDLSRDLLYYQKSPDFCERDRSLDLPGTRGRRCNRTAIATTPDSCSALCCGRGYDLVRRRKVERCNCKFVWCCQVECQMCSFEEWVSVCK